MNLDEIKLSDNRFLLLLKPRVKGSDFFSLIEAENRDSEVLKSSFGLSYPLSVCLLLLYFFICKYLNISNIQNEAPYFFPLLPHILIENFLYFCSDENQVKYN